MCGRFTLRRPGAEVASQLGLREVPQLTPRYNVAPGQPIAIVRAADTGERVLEQRRWGLVPSGAADPRVGSRLINARAETAARRPAFASALRARRCLVPADGFYEWTGARVDRSAFHVHLPGDALFAMAAIWEAWLGRGGERIDSCAILTTDASPELRRLHDRMPLILAPRDHALWLDPAVRDPARLAPLLAAPAGVRLELRAVGPRVNRPEADDPSCLEPAGPPAQGSLRF